MRSVEDVRGLQGMKHLDWRTAYEKGCNVETELCNSYSGVLNIEGQLELRTAEIPRR